MPKYKEIADEIRSKILNNEYERGQKLPYEYMLCVTYHCNKETMKKALEILVKEGYIIRRRGSGTFVKDNNPAELDTIINSRSLTSRHRHDHIDTKVVTFEVIPCNAFLAEKLHIDKGDFVYHVVRYRKINSQPYVVSVTYIPLSLIPNLKLETLKHSFYEFITNKMKMKIQSTQITITAHQPNEEERSFLELKENEPYIQEACVSYLTDGHVLEYSMDRINYRNYEFKTNIINQ